MTRGFLVQGVGWQHIGAQPSTGPSAFGARRGLGTGCCWEEESSCMLAGPPLCICCCLARKPHKALLFGPCLQKY